MKFKITKKSGYTNIEVIGGELRLSDKKIVFESELLNKVFPVGSLYLNINSTSPASLFGGTWERLPAGYALWTATSGAGGTIAAGLPNITGYAGGIRTAYTGSDWTGTGAFLSSTQGDKDGMQASKYCYRANLSFKASDSNNIYGSSTTVQPPAYKIYAWKRIS